MPRSIATAASLTPIGVTTKPLNISARTAPPHVIGLTNTTKPLSAARATSANGASITATGIAFDPWAGPNKGCGTAKTAQDVRVLRTKKEGRLDRAALPFL